MPHPKDRIVSLIPSLRYGDAAKAIDWLCDAFNFERHLVVPGEGGAIAHAQLRFGNGMLMLGSGGSHEGGDNERPFDKRVQPLANIEEVRPSSIYMIVDDVDAHCTRARAAGAEIIMEPEDVEYWSRSYTCCDLEGNVFTFGGYDPLAED